MLTVYHIFNAMSIRNARNYINFHFKISNLTNSGLLTIERHYTLKGSSAFLHFEVSETQDIGTANTEMHHKREKALDLQGLSANI